jgi:MFS family permease
MASTPARRISVVSKYLFFWLFLVFFKLGAGLQYTLLPVLGARVMPIWVVGAIMFVSTSLQIILDIPAGKLLDRFGYKTMLMVGTLGAIIGVMLYFYGINIYTLILSIFLVDFGWLFYTPGGTAYVLSHASKSNSIKFFSYLHVFGAIGIVAGTMLLAFTVNAPGPVLALLLGGALVIAMVSIFLAPKDRKIITRKTSPHMNTHKQRSYLLANISSAIKRLTPASTLLMLLECVSGIFYGIVWFVLPLIIASALYNGTLLTAGLATFDFTSIVVGSYLAKKVKNKSLKGLVFIGLVVFAISGFLLGTNFGILFILFAVLSSTGNEIASIPLWVWMHHLDRNHNQDGLVSGIVDLTSEIGWAVGPLLAGILYVLVGPSFTIIIGAIPIGVVLAIYYATVRRHIVKLSLFTVPPKPHRVMHKS